MRILFILKAKNPYGDGYGDCFTGSMSTGLLNSVKFVEYALAGEGYEVKSVVVHDNNDIDREVTEFQPDAVVVEALWVVPEKFDELAPLHPDVKWIVRLHSAIPFIANEGVAMAWIAGYLRRPNVYVSCNDQRPWSSVKRLAGHIDLFLARKVLYQPNVYDLADAPFRENGSVGRLNIGCFGAIRPMKNQLAQAIAAVRFADTLGRQLDFHINGSRVEMKGSPVLNNLRGLFSAVAERGHRLIEWPWLEHDQFLELCATMDLGMQVSHTETFNIVAADLVAAGVPVVGSPEIYWLPNAAMAVPDDDDSMVHTLAYALAHREHLVHESRRHLREASERNLQHWTKSLEGLER